MPAQSVYPGDEYDFAMDKYYATMKQLRDQLSITIEEIEVKMKETWVPFEEW